jgi:hypothetical protein
MHRQVVMWESETGEFFRTEEEAIHASRVSKLRKELRKIFAPCSRFGADDDDDVDAALDLITRHVSEVAAAFKKYNA